MPDIARLGFDIDTSLLDRANQGLQDIATNANNAQRAAASLSSTLGSIRQPQAASAMGAVSPGGVAAATGAANAASAVAAAQNQVATASTAAAAAQTSAATAATRLSAANTNVAASARNAAQSNAALQASAEGLSSTYKVLISLLVGGILGKAIDQWIQLGNAMDLARVKEDDQQGTMEKLFDIANRNNVSIESLTTLYRRAAIAATSMGASQDDLLKITQASTAALKIQGTSADAARGALLQLGQSFGTGRLRMQEFNSVTENLQPLAQAAAKALLGPTAGITHLRAAIEAGTVTSKQWSQAIIQASDDLQKLADNANVTTSQALTNVWNGFVRLVGAFDTATGASKILTDAIQGLGNALTSAAKWIETNKDSFPDFATNLTAIATVITTLLIPAFILLGAEALKSAAKMAAAFLANPFGLLVAGIAAVVAALYGLKQVFPETFKDVIDVVKQVAEAIIKAFQLAFVDAKFTWNNFSDIVGNAYEEAANAVIGVINWLAKQVKSAFYDLVAFVEGIIERLKALNPLAAVTPATSAVAATNDLKDALDAVAAAKQRVALIDNAGTRAELNSAQIRLDVAQKALNIANDAADASARAKKATEDEIKARREADINKPLVSEIAPNVDRKARLGAAEDLRNQQMQQIMDSHPIDALTEAFTRAAKAVKDFGTAQDTAMDPTKKGKRDPWETLIIHADDYIRKAQTAAKALTQSFVDAREAVHFTEMYNKALDARIPITDKVIEKLHGLARAQADADLALEKSKILTDAAKNSQEAVANSKAEADALGMSTVAGEAWVETQKIVNAEKKKGIDLSPAEIKAIQDAATATAKAKDETKQYSDALAFVRDVATTAFKSLLQDLQQGKSLWEAFGNAAQKALSKILDKLEDLAINSVFDMIMKGSSFSETGLGGFLGGLGRIFGGSGSSGGIASGGAGSTGTSSGFFGGLKNIFSGFGNSLSDMWGQTLSFFDGTMAQTNAALASAGLSGGGIFGSGISGMGALGALGGGISGIMSLMKGGTANTIGGIGSLIGAGVSLIPGIGQIAGPLIALASSFLPGLFGESKPTITNQAYGDLRYGPGGFQTSGGAWGPNADAGSLQGPLGQLGQGMTSIFNMFKKGVVDVTKVWGVALESFNQQYGDGSSFSNQTSFLISPGGVKSQFGQGSSALDVGAESAAVVAAINSIFAGAVGPISDAMKTALGHVGGRGVTLQNLADAVNFVLNVYEKLGKTVTQSETAFQQIDAQFQQISDTATALGLSLDPVNAALKKAKEEVASGVLHDINMFFDPLKTGLDDFEKARVKGMAEVNYLVEQGFATTEDAARAAQYYLKKEAELKEQLYGVSVQQLQDALDRLLTGNLSGATGTTAYNALLKQFQDTASAAIAGDTSATAKIVDQAMALAEAGQRQFGSGQAYEDLKTMIENILISVQNMIGDTTSPDKLPVVTEPNPVDTRIAQLTGIVNSQNTQIDTLLKKLTSLTDLLQRTATNQ